MAEALNNLDLDQMSIVENAVDPEATGTNVMLMDNEDEMYGDVLSFDEKELALF